MADDVISKSEFAEALGVTRGCVSQLIRAGLPVRAEGKLDRGVALRLGSVRKGGQLGPSISTGFDLDLKLPKLPDWTGD